MSSQILVGAQSMRRKKLRGAAIYIGGDFSTLGEGYNIHLGVHLPIACLCYHCKCHRDYKDIIIPLNVATLPLLFRVSAIMGKALYFGEWIQVGP